MGIFLTDPNRMCRWRIGGTEQVGAPSLFPLAKGKSATGE